MALQDGFKELGLEVWDGGGGFEHRATGSLYMRAPGSHSINVGSGFAGRYYVSSPFSGGIRGVIYSASIQAQGKNYSSGSWGYQFGGTAAPGEFCTLAIEGVGSSSIILPTIGQDVSMSFSDLNRERGVAVNAQASLSSMYGDFSAIAGSVHTDLTGKPNFDWFQGGPVSASAQNPIRLDEFYGSNYSQYGGVGCLAVGTKIQMADGSEKNIEDINIGEQVKSATVPNMPLDFDEEDTWISWVGTPNVNEPDSTWDTAYYDIQEINRVRPASASVMDIYFDFYESYYLVNGSLKVTYEHPFFILRDGTYHIKTVASLRPGDYLFKSDNTFEEIESVRFIDEKIETVNLNVENLDVYFGGGYLMHNVYGKD